jgi:magnesium transporter
MLLAVCHSDSEGWQKVDDLSQLSTLREQAGTLLWAEADVKSLTEDDVRLIADEFSLHELAVEDAMNARQRPKFENYDTHQFLVMHELDEVDGQLESIQIACFIGKQYVLVIHAGADRTLKEAKDRWEQILDRNHPSALLHTLMDVVVDDYQAHADRLEAEVEDLEEIVLNKPDAPVQRQLYSVKQRLARMRRYVFPAARLLDWAIDSTANHPFSEETGRLFRDIDDHLQRIKDQIGNLDALDQALIDLTRNEQAAMMNEQSRKLAAWAAIFGAATVIAGIYGMNFSLVPEEGSLVGFWFAMALIAASTGGLYLYFRRRGWL